ncbi:DNA-processing protein DprA [Vineibacter terrae]|uniref:DNA-processing protein DprA n=1 Tax=Vineibacter terrae TaxID=2586908 RepID=UPI002E308B61|nr:DNA-processing protein DprA [Vineibacter terrae]HEX2890934.1 DNA-processing protein DprA [Vineibacter terrae]
MAARYAPPADWKQTSLGSLLEGTGRALQPASGRKTRAGERTVFVAGDVALLRLACVSVIGSRRASAAGEATARTVAQALVAGGIVVMSGLADGVDSAAMNAAIDAGGRTVGVIGTPLDKAYPAANARLQERVYRDHLLVSQFASGAQVRPGNFPARNKLMCALSDASVIVEAADGSGTLHQADECVRLGRWLFVARAVLDDRALSWPAKYAAYERFVALENASQILEHVRTR